MPASGFPIELTRPFWLFGLVVLPALALYFWWSLVDFSRTQRIASLLARSAVVVLLVLSLAGLSIIRSTRDQYVVVAVDRSLSVDESAFEAADAFVKEAAASAGNHRVARLDFATVPGAVREMGDLNPPEQELDRKGTDIAAAIEVAAAAIPPNRVPRLVILSDGNATSGDALKAALKSGLPIDTLALATRDDPEVQVSAVEAPAQIAQGEPFPATVVIDTNVDENAGTLDLYRGDIKVASQPVKLRKGENRFTFTQSIEGDRLAKLTARVSGFRDTLLDNNSDFGLVFAAGKPRILLIDGDSRNSSRDLAYALEEQGMQVDSRPPQGMPESLADMQNYECLVLSNVPATALNLRKMDVARTYVQELGGGLIMLGGDQSFGLGGYYKTSIEEILPVRSDFEKEKEKPSLAMVLVIDKSGSMGGEKIEMAKEAARAAVELLGPSDKVGVIAFDGEPFWISEVHPAADKPFVLDRIASIEAGGGTAMYPAMEEAYDALQRTVAKLKHVIILTDGISLPGDFEGISQQMAAARMTISTVGVGQELDEQLLQEIARIGNGRHYLVEDPSTVPQIFAKETVAASKSAINEQPFTPVVVRPTKVLNDLGLDEAPLLLGFVVTRPKPTSEVILATESGEPLLTWWRYGLGMSVAFTSDAKNRWAAEWLSWPGYAKFWAQVVRHAMRQAETKGIVAKVERKGREAVVAIDAIDAAGKFLNQADTTLSVIDPRQNRTTLTMEQSAPGRYVATVPTSEAGDYHFMIAQKYRGQPIYNQTRGLAVGYPDELRLKATNRDLLSEIARGTGGRIDPRAAELFAADERVAPRVTPLWPWLVTAAALVFVGDVALRRLDFAVGNRRGVVSRNGVGV
ncbi:MAG: VWA domain-containing protein [Isosphaeraceae bacterium]